MTYKNLFIFSFLVSVLACAPKINHLAKVTPSSYRIQATDSIQADKHINEMVAPYKTQLDAKMNKVIGKTLQEMPKRQPESLLFNFLADAWLIESQKAYTKPIDFFIANDGGIRVPLPKGDIVVSKIYELMPFDNQLVVVDLDGKTCKMLFDKMARTGGWPISKTARYEIYQKQAQNISINNQAFDETKNYTVAMPDFIANGGSDCPFLKGKTQVGLGKLMRDALLEHIEDLTKNGKPIASEQDSRVLVVQN